MIKDKMSSFFLQIRLFSTTNLDLGNTWPLWLEAEIHWTLASDPEIPAQEPQNQFEGSTRVFSLPWWPRIPLNKYPCHYKKRWSVETIRDAVEAISQTFFLRFKRWMHLKRIRWRRYLRPKQSRRYNYMQRELQKRAIYSETIIGILCFLSLKSPTYCKVGFMWSNQIICSTWIGQIFQHHFADVQRVFTKSSLHQL